MEIKNIKSAGDPDAIYAYLQNKEGATLNRGEVVEWDTDNTLGVSVEELDSATAKHVAGVVEDTTIADGEYGLVQIYGLHDAVLTSTTVTVGAAVSGTVESSVGKVVDHTTSTDAAADLAAAIIGVALEVVDTDSAKVFIRLM